MQVNKTPYYKQSDLLNP